jgi:hypothetical protein
MSLPTAIHRIRLAALGLLLILALAALPTSGADASACHAGVHAYGTAQIRTFCGPASVTLIIAGKQVKLSGGTCTRTSQYLSVNIGSALLGTTKKAPPNYFGLDVGKTPGGGTPAPTDGTYPAFALAFASGGKSDSSTDASVTLTNGRRRGTFTGTRLLSSGTVSGSFNCG